MVQYARNTVSCGIKKIDCPLKIIFVSICSAHATLHVFVVFIKQMELVDKPGSKSAVWKFFGLKCDEEERPIIDGHVFCQRCKSKVAARSGNTSNLIAHLWNNHPTIYADFVKQKAEKLGQIFKKLREQKASSPSTSGTGTMTVPEKLESEIDHYIKSPVADSESDPLQWWKINYVHYPFLAKIAKKYLSISATSCPSERPFSSSGKIVSTLRNNLKPEKVNMLVFLSKNIK